MKRQEDRENVAREETRKRDEQHAKDQARMMVTAVEGPNPTQLKFRLCPELHC